MKILRTSARHQRINRVHQIRRNICEGEDENGLQIHAVPKKTAQWILAQIIVCTQNISFQFIA